MSENTMTDHIPTPNIRTTARRPGPALRAESNVKVNLAMANIIRAARLRPEHEVSFSFFTIAISVRDQVLIK